MLTVKTLPVDVTPCAMYKGPCFTPCLNLLCIVNDRWLIQDVTLARLKKFLSSILFSSQHRVCLYVSE